MFVYKIIPLILSKQNHVNINDSTSNYTTLLVEVVASLTLTLAAVFDELAGFVASLALTLTTVVDELARFVESLALTLTAVFDGLAGCVESLALA